MLRNSNGTQPVCSPLFVATLAIIGSMKVEAAIPNHKFDWHGFLSQGVMQAPDSSFVNLDGDLSTKLTELGLNASYEINQELRLAGQLIYLNADNRYNEGGRLDYLFLNWSAYTGPDWDLALNLGKFKNSHWLYSATRDVPHTRPSIILPQSIYFDVLRDATLAIEGINSSLSYITSLGTLNLSLSAGKGDVKDSTKMLLSQQAKGELEMDQSFITSISFTPDSERWLFNLSYLNSEIDYQAAADDYFVDGEVEITRHIGGIVYSGSHWELTAELLQEKVVTSGLQYPGYYLSQISQGGYLQSRFFANDSLILLARYDTFDRDKDDRNGSQLSAASGGVVPAHLGYMDDATLGVEWQIKQNLKLQAEFHRLRGTARLGPTLTPNISINQKEYWNLWALQLSYWF